VRTKEFSEIALDHPNQSTDIDPPNHRSARNALPCEPHLSSVLATILMRNLMPFTSVGANLHGERIDTAGRWCCIGNFTSQKHPRDVLANE
jgi:hypothetical protein